MTGSIRVEYYYILKDFQHLTPHRYGRNRKHNFVLSDQRLILLFIFRQPAGAAQAQRFDSRELL
jgi:hypothetical protein